MQKYIIVALGIIAGIVAVAFISLTALCNDNWCHVFSWQKAPTAIVTNFDECVSKSGIIAESYPRQCRYGGKMYVEKIAVPKTFVECIAQGGEVPAVGPRRCLHSGREFAEQNTVDTSADPVKISITANQLISSPLQLTGEALGQWYFEASFPIQILDANEKVLGVGLGQATADWMQEGFVPFTAKIEFEKSTTSTGFLVLQKDNPSGLPENAGEFRVPIRFK